MTARDYLLLAELFSEALIKSPSLHLNDFVRGQTKELDVKCPVIPLAYKLLTMKVVDKI